MSTGAVEARTPAGATALGGGNVGEVAWLAFPVVVQTLSETAMQVIDSAMAGRLGATQLGAIGFAGLWVWTLLVGFAGTAQGVQTFVARHHGSGETQQCGPWLWQSIWLTVPAITLWAIAVSFAFPVLVAWIGPSPELQTEAVAYAWGRLLGAPAIAATFALTAFFRGLGDTRTPLFAALIGVAVNVVLAYLLIFGEFGLPQLGVGGAGIAMAAGSWTIASVLLVLVLRPHLRARYRTGEIRPDRTAMRRYLRTSAPVGGQWLLDMTTFAIFGSLVARMGDVSMAASQAMLQLLSVSFMQAYAISIAAGTLVGRYLGARDFEAAERSYRSAQLLGLGVCAIVALLFVCVPELLLSIFSRDPVVLELARPLLRLGALFQVIDAVGIIAGGSLRGAGDTRWPFLVHATLAWALRLPAVWLFAVWLEGGVYGAWVGELVFISALSSFNMLRFRAGSWRSVRL